MDGFRGSGACSAIRHLPDQPRYAAGRASDPPLPAGAQAAVETARINLIYTNVLLIVEGVQMAKPGAKVQPEEYRSRASESKTVRQAPETAQPAVTE